MTRRADDKQLVMDLPKPKCRWGGRREGAGRKRLPADRRKGLSHVTRPFHDRSHPVHVTMKIVRGLPNLRCKELARAIGAAIRKGKLRDGFRVVHFSLQHNHMHFIVEALGRKTLSMGLRVLAIRIAWALNRALGRKGRVFADRYHAHALTRPKETRNAMVYVMTNYKHHTRERFEFDPWSSAWWFQGWTRPPPTTERSCPVEAPSTWLLRSGWRRHGLLSPEEAPADQ